MDTPHSGTFETGTAPSILEIGAPDPAPGPRLPLHRRALSAIAERIANLRASASHFCNSVNIAPDLAQDIGSRTWFRGLGTLIVLSGIALAFWPDFAPLRAAPPLRMDESARDEFRSQMIMPLALGGDSGRHMGATARVVPLAAAPERPQLQFIATLQGGNSLVPVLQRAGVSSADAARVEELVARAIPLSEIANGTQMDITVGRRASPGSERPLDKLRFRARFDLELDVSRNGGTLALERRPIRVDDTPLRIRGEVGPSLYRSARAAGAPASVVQDYLKALGKEVDLDNDLRETDTFDIVVAYRRAATGERQAGKLLYAGFDRNDRPQHQLMRWGEKGEFYDAAGVGEQKGSMVAPVPGGITSNFGMRRHPILGYTRMHSGVDFKARYGTPIVAATDGRVSGAGRMGGCGNAVRINHAQGLQTRYCHMSQIAVGYGQAVRRGQVIGYVGSSGLSTGAHLHYEMYRGGRAIDPRSVSFVTRAMLEGEELRRFREALLRIKKVVPGAALEDLERQPTEVEAPRREIELAEQPKVLG